MMGSVGKLQYEITSTYVYLHPAARIKRIIIEHFV